MRVLGLRVIRGPHWQGGDKDGGEGHVGTVTKLLSNQDVQVVWDMGEASTCKTGSDDTYELRVLDTAQIGIAHPETCCAVCGERDIKGFRWRCQQCDLCDLCPLCYNEDKHDLRHQFLRIDAPGLSGKPVPKRKTSVQTRALGLFPGSKVTRGPDWQWGEQDGGEGSEGEVTGYETRSQDGARNLVWVLWADNTQACYRLGLEGKLDLTCTEEELGPCYYRDHLPVLDAELISKLSKAVNRTSKDLNTDPSRETERDAECMTPKTSEASHSANAVATDSTSYEAAAEQTATNIQQEDRNQRNKSHPMANADTEYTNFSSLGMEKLIGLSCAGGNDLRNSTRQDSIASGNCDIMEKAKVQDLFSKGDKVRICGDVENAKHLNRRVGWKSDMELVVGQVGQVINIDSDGDLLVTFGRRHFLFDPVCCTYVTSGTGPVTMDEKKKPGNDGMETGTGHGPVPITTDVKETAQAPIPKNMDVKGMERDPVPISTDDCGEPALQPVSGTSSDADGNRKALFQRLREIVINETADSEASSVPCDPELLFSALSRKDYMTVRRLCSAYEFMVEYEHNRLTPLMKACRVADLDLVQLLLSFGADVNHCIAPKRSPLKIALQGKNEEICVLLLEKGADPFYVDDNLRTHMHVAAYFNLPRVILALSERGVDVNAKDCSQDTALHIAISKHKHEAVEAMMKIPGVDLTVTNVNGYPLLHHACTRSNPRALELMLATDQSLVNSYCHGMTPLFLAAKEDDDECVRVLVLSGNADISLRAQHQKFTPLHMACNNGSYKAAVALLELGADLHCRESRGHTPLHLVIGVRSTDDTKSPEGQEESQLRVALACLLISNGAYVDARDYSGREPLSYGVSDVREGVESFIRQNPQLVKREHVGGTFDVSNMQDKKAKGGGELKEALKGVGLPCGVCGHLKSDVTLQPCQHKCVCSKCKVKVTQCPLCDEEVKDSVVTGEDDQIFDLNNWKQM